jgi:aryl-alcohol dehydrogenase-like predicted oxidoreductase
LRCRQKYSGVVKKNVNGVKCKQVRDACAAALICLKVDYLDLYFCHRPSIDTPIEETLRAMYNLIVQGKVVYWGTSEWSAQQITEAHAYASAHHLTPPTMANLNIIYYIEIKLIANF